MHPPADRHPLAGALALVPIWLVLAARGESHSRCNPKEGLGWTGICGVAAIRGISFNTATSRLLASARPSSISLAKRFRHGLLSLASLAVTLVMVRPLRDRAERVERRINNAEDSVR